MAAMKKSERGQVQGDLHRHPRRRRLHRGRRERQSHRPEARRQPEHARLLRLQLPRGECGQAEGHRDQRRRSRPTRRSAASNIPAPARSTSTSRTRTPGRSRRSAPSSPNSPRKARSGRSGYLLRSRADRRAEQRPRAQPGGRARPGAAQSRQPQIGSTSRRHMNSERRADRAGARGLHTEAGKGKSR